MVALTLGVDVQADRIEAALVGWGACGESWIVRQFVIWGDPTSPRVWADLDGIVATRYEHARNVEPLQARACCIDTGAATLSVYAWVKTHRGGVWGIKGMSQPGKPLWPKTASRKNKGRIPLHLLNVDAGKDMLYARLKVKDHGPGFVHLHSSLAENQLEQLVAEKVKTTFVRGRPGRAWVLPNGARNELLDCYVYAMAALHGLSAQGFDLEREAAILGTISLRDLANPQEPQSVFVPVKRKVIRSAFFDA